MLKNTIAYLLLQKLTMTNLALPFRKVLQNIFGELKKYYKSA